MIIRDGEHRESFREPVVPGRPVSPGEVLHEEFLVALGINQRALALAIDVPPIRISEIVRGKRAITADTAMRLAACFGTSPEFWLNLQSQWELSKLRETRAGDYAFITKVTTTSV
jgi:addiction module HigA family antidote